MMQRFSSTNRARLVVLISGNGSNLQAIIDRIEAEQWPISIAAVISNKANAYGLQRAQQAGIVTEVINHRDFPDRVSYDQQLKARIEHYQADLIVLAGFMRILSPQFVMHFAGQLINIHPSLLPKFKGLHTYQRAIEAGETEHGCSVHYVTAELDAGQIIDQARCAISSDDNADSLQQKVHQLEHELYPRVIYDLLIQPDISHAT